MEKQRKEMWELIFKIIEENAEYEFINQDYYCAKRKILNDNYKEVESSEFKSLYNALKRAENVSYHAGYPTVAYMCRRVGFHSKEEGLYEFAYLKDKYGGCYIATAVYGSYEAPEVLFLRKFRDLYLEKRNWGRKFVVWYYKNSPRLAEKLHGKKTVNKYIRIIFDNILLKIAALLLGDKNV